MAIGSEGMQIQLIPIQQDPLLTQFLKAFSQEQAEDLDGVLWKSYFA